MKKILCISGAARIWICIVQTTVCHFISEIFSTSPTMPSPRHQIRLKLSLQQIYLLLPIILSLPCEGIIQSWLFLWLAALPRKAHTSPSSTNIGLGQALGHRKWRAVTCSMFSSSEDDCGLVVLSPFGRSFSLDSRIKTSLKRTDPQFDCQPHTKWVRKEVFVLQAIKDLGSCESLCLLCLLTINASYIYLLTALCVLSFLGPFMSASWSLGGSGPAACCFSWLFLVTFSFGVCDF